MKDKDIIVMAVGLIVVIVISAWVINANNESMAQSIKSIYTMNSFLLQQKDFQIEKLVKLLDLKQKELADTKAMLESVKIKSGNQK